MQVGRSMFLDDKTKQLFCMRTLFHLGFGFRSMVKFSFLLIFLEAHIYCHAEFDTSEKLVPLWDISASPSLIENDGILKQVQDNTLFNLCYALSFLRRQESRSFIYRDSRFPTRD